MNEKDVTNKPVKLGIRHGISLIPADRTQVGTAPNLSVTDNVIMKNYDQDTDFQGLEGDHPQKLITMLRN